MLKQSIRLIALTFALFVAPLALADDLEGNVIRLSSTGEVKVEPNSPYHGEPSRHAKTQTHCRSRPAHLLQKKQCTFLLPGPKPTSNPFNFKYLQRSNGHSYCRSMTVCGR